MVIDMPMHIGLQVNAKSLAFKSQLSEAKNKVQLYKDNISALPPNDKVQIMEVIIQLETLIKEAPQIQRLLNIERQQAWN